MNLLLHDDPQVCADFLALLGVAAGLSRVDEDGGFTVIAVNDLARKFYGMGTFAEPTKLTVENVTTLLDDERDPAFLQAYVERMHHNYGLVASRGVTLNTETEMMTADGRLRWSRNTLTPVFDEERVARIIVTFADVTEIREAKDELEASLASFISRSISMCAGCDRVLDADRWITMGEYMMRHSDRRFSHGICEDCATEYFGVNR